MLKLWVLYGKNFNHRWVIKTFRSKESAIDAWKGERETMKTSRRGWWVDQDIDKAIQEIEVEERGD